jgi:hypothetical protein
MATLNMPFLNLQSKPLSKTLKNDMKKIEKYNANLKKQGLLTDSMIEAINEFTSNFEGGYTLLKAKDLGGMVINCVESPNYNTLLAKCVISLFCFDREFERMKKEFLNWDEDELKNDLSESQYLFAAKQIKEWKNLRDKHFDDYLYELCQQKLWVVKNGNPTKSVAEEENIFDPFIRGCIKEVTDLLKRMAGQTVSKSVSESTDNNSSIKPPPCPWLNNISVEQESQEKVDKKRQRKRDKKRRYNQRKKLRNSK